MTCGVYAYQDNIKNKIVYIGASHDCESRNKTHYHLSNMRKQYINYILQNDIDNRYSFLVLLECSKKDIWDKEAALIKLIEPEYNNKILKKDLSVKNTRHTNNKTGLFHVTESKKQWSYRYNCNGKSFSCYKSSLRDLEYLVKKNNFPWFIIDKDLADKNYYISDNKKNNTLYYNVRKKKANNKFGYIYYYKKDGFYFSSMYIEELEYKVKENGLDWRSFL